VFLAQTVKVDDALRLAVTLPREGNTPLPADSAGRPVPAHGPCCVTSTAPPTNEGECVSASPTMEDWLAAAVSSHERLSRLVGQLGPDEVAGPSYCTEWSIAQVLSHLGSGAQIFSLFLRAGLGGGPAPGMPEFEPIWERWNAMPPAVQSAEGLVADRIVLDQLLALDDQQRQSWRLDMFGEVRDLTGLLQLRLGEHAVHSWDVAVIRDPTATVAPEAAALLIDTLDQLVARIGRAPDGLVRVSVATDGPDRRFLLVSDDDGVQLHPVDDLTGDHGTPSLELPAEAFIRLVYGRLDPDHTPAGSRDQGTLDLLRRTFPGP
jgi:uncharacterized protein (TIGR03083 family)